MCPGCARGGLTDLERPADEHGAGWEGGLRDARDHELYCLMSHLCHGMPHDRHGGLDAGQRTSLSNGHNGDIFGDAERGSAYSLVDPRHGERIRRDDARRMVWAGEKSAHFCETGSAPPLASHDGALNSLAPTHLEKPPFSPTGWAVTKLVERLATIKKGEAAMTQVREALDARCHDEFEVDIY